MKRGTKVARRGVGMFRDLIAMAEDQNWTVTHTGGGHLKWKSPDGQVVFSSYSPSDQRARQQHIKELRKRGFRYPK